MSLTKLVSVQNGSISGEGVTLERVELAALNGKAVKGIYMKRIPKADRIPIDELKQKFSGKKTYFYTMHSAESPGEISGIVLASEYPSYLYIDYIATHENTRGTRLGKRALTAFTRHFSGKKPIVVKIGEPGPVYYSKRSDFYRKHCQFEFVVTGTLAYHQPDMPLDKPALITALRSEKMI